MFNPGIVRAEQLTVNRKERRAFHDSNCTQKKSLKCTKATITLNRTEITGPVVPFIGMTTEK
jgi:hypothetical protein